MTKNDLHKEYEIGTIWAHGYDRWQRRENPIWKYIGKTKLYYDWYPRILIEEPHEKDIYD